MYSKKSRLDHLGPSLSTAVSLSLDIVVILPQAVTSGVFFISVVRRALSFRGVALLYGTIEKQKSSQYWQAIQTHTRLSRRGIVLSTEAIVPSLESVIPRSRQCVHDFPSSFPCHHLGCPSIYRSNHLRLWLQPS